MESSLNSNLTPISSDTITITVGSVSFNLTFILYSNGMREVRSANGLLSADSLAASGTPVPEKYRPYTTCRLIGFNSQYNNANTDKIRGMEISASGALTVYASAFSGLYINAFYL